MYAMRVGGTNYEGCNYCNINGKEEYIINWFGVGQ